LRPGSLREEFLAELIYPHPNAESLASRRWGVHSPTQVSAAADFTLIPRAIAIAAASRLLPVTAVGCHSKYDQKKINLFYCTRPATVCPPIDGTPRAPEGR
jgi:hypothetical protein